LDSGASRVTGGPDDHTPRRMITHLEQIPDKSL
jgi:hypothetical protein